MKPPEPAYVSSATTSLYDAFNPWGVADDFYASLVDTSVDSILDIGCGTGTLACEFSRLDRHVTAIDPSIPMLDIARQKQGASRVDWHCADATVWHTTQRFDLITMTGHAFQCLRSDAAVIALFNRIHQWLTTHGRFVFESRNPEIDWVSRWNARAGTAILAGGQTVTEVTHATQSAHQMIKVIQHYTMPDRVESHTDTLRFPNHVEISAHAINSKLAVNRVTGDWLGSPFDPTTSLEMVFDLSRQTESTR